MSSGTGHWACTQPALCSLRGWGRSSSPQGLRCFGNRGIILLPVPVWASHLLNRTVCGTVRCPLQGLSGIIPLLVLPASDNLPYPRCQTELRPPGRTQPTHPLHRSLIPQQARAANIPIENLPV